MILTIQVKIDKELCSGAGRCEEICPEIFKVVKGKATVLADPIPTEEQDLVFEAMKRCPSGAISMS